MEATQKQIKERIINYKQNASIKFNPMTKVYIQSALSVLENLPHPDELRFLIEGCQKSRDKSIQVCAKWREYNFLKEGK
jgi:hypothetical protein